MQRGKWIGFGLGAVIAAAGLGGLTVVGCSGDDNGTGAGDSGSDRSVTDTGPGTDDASPDTGPTPDSGGDAAPKPVFAKVYLAHASNDAPPLRFCFGIASSGDGGGSVTITPGLYAQPDDDTVSTALGEPFPAVFAGTGGPVSAPAGIDLASLNIAVYAIDATAIAGDVKSKGTSESDCSKMLGTTAGGGTVPAGHYWYLGTIAKGVLADGTTWLVAVTGCRPGETGGNAALCGAPYDANKGNLALRPFKVDNATAVDSTHLGAQFVHASPSWDVAFGGAAMGETTYAGFVVPVPPSDAGAGDAGDAGDAGGPTGPTTQKIPITGVTGAHFGDLQPTSLAPVTGVTYDGTSDFFAVALGPDGGVLDLGGQPGVAALPLTTIQQLTYGPVTPDGGALRNGAGFVFMLLGNPTEPAFVNDAGAPAAPDAGGRFNGYTAHFLAFPVANP